MPVDSYTTPNGTADHALFVNQDAWAREGYGVISGCGISVGSGDYDVDIASGEVFVAGSTVSIDAQTVTLSSPGTDPRWDVLSIDEGNAQGNRVVVTEGSEQPAQTDSNDNRLTQLESAFPVPPSFEADPSTIIGIVWVEPQSSSLTSADLIDRRVSARSDSYGSTIINEFDTRVDRTITLRGPYSERPSTGDYDNQLYHAADRRILYRWDAGTDSWEAISGLGSDANPVPGTSHFEALEADDTQTTKLGHDVEDLNDRSGSRSTNTVYQNTADYNLLVVIVVENQTGSSTLVNQRLLVDSTSSPSTSHDGASRNVNDRRKLYYRAVVPPGNYYEFSSVADGTVTIWNEGLYQ